MKKVKYKSKYHRKSVKNIINYSAFDGNYRVGDIVIEYAWSKKARENKSTGSNENICMVVEKKGDSYVLLNLQSGCTSAWCYEDFMEMHTKGVLWEKR